MTIATHEIAKLDRQLAKKGEIITVRRRISTGDTFASITARARLSGYTGAEVQGDVRVTDSKFVITPTPFTGATWPAAAGGINYPQIGDFIVSQSRSRAIVQCERVMIGDTVVRIEGRVR